MKRKPSSAKTNRAGGRKFARLSWYGGIIWLTTKCGKRWIVAVVQTVLNAFFPNINLMMNIMQNSFAWSLNLRGAKTFVWRWKKPSGKIQKSFQANLLRRCVRRAWYNSQNVHNSPVDNRAGICYNIGKVENTNIKRKCGEVDDFKKWNWTNSSICTI